MDWLLDWMTWSLLFDQSIDWSIDWLMCSTRARGDTNFALVFTLTRETGKEFLTLKFARNPNVSIRNHYLSCSFFHFKLFKREQSINQFHTLWAKMEKFFQQVRCRQWHLGKKYQWKVLTNYFPNVKMTTCDVFTQKFLIITHHCYFSIFHKKFFKKRRKNFKKFFHAEKNLDCAMFGVISFSEKMHF